jgi:peptide/nickel transport system substrate-binding protein
MSESSYWNRLLQARLSRRRAAMASAGAGAGALLLSACGGEDSGGDGDSSSLVVKAVDSTKDAKPGGVMKDSRNADIGHWDPHLSGAWWSFANPAIYSRLTRLKAGHLEPASGEVVGDLAESWEFSPDGLTATFKLRPNVTWHQIAPVNGRAFDSQDVIYTWTRFAKEGGNRSNFANAVNPMAPIVSLTAPDRSTVVANLSFSMVNLTALLAAHSGGNFAILPREQDGGYDIRTRPIGTGPYIMAEHSPSQRFVYQKNPHYYDKSGPYVDGVEYPIITEYAQGLAQLKAGGLYTYLVAGEDMLQTKRDVPALSLYEGAMQSLGSGVVFGYRNSEKAPFRDERLRQAFSLTWDRDQFIDVQFNVSGLTSQGIPVKTLWSTALQNNYFADWYIDPKSKEFGPNAKYFRRDVAEAKKLVAAAGYAEGLEVVSNVISGSDYGVDYHRHVDILEGFANEAGFRFSRVAVPYQTEFIPKIRDAQGNFDGIAWKLLTPATPPDGIEAMVAYFSKGGGATFQGIDPDGQGTFAGDPYIEEQLRKARAEVDPKKAHAIVHDIQRHVAGKAYMWRAPGGATGLDIAWPVIRNFNTYESEYRAHFSEWLDPNQPPLKKT